LVKTVYEYTVIVPASSIAPSNNGWQIAACS
jgi:hypothetical protein